MSILICSVYPDLHASAVRWALAGQYREQVHYLSLRDFPGVASISALPALPHANFHIRGTDIDVSSQDITSTWVRRLPDPKVLDSVHEADRAFAKTQSRQLSEALLDSLSASTFCVNPVLPGRKYGNKIPQIEAARTAGFDVPETLVSNCPATIRQFFSECNGDVIHKPLTQCSWIGDGKSASPATVQLREIDLLDDGVLAACPGIFQRHIRKALELRITVIGSTVFAAALHTQEQGQSIDWRFDFRGRPPMSQFELPASVRATCLDFMRLTGLVFGCLDVIIEPSGRYVFLEVNEMGQWLWVERDIPEFLMLDAFAQLLVTRDRDLIHHPGPQPARMIDFMDHYSQNHDAYISEAERHIPVGHPTVYDERSTQYTQGGNASVDAR